MIYIVTGPTHCGKSTYIEETKKPEDIVLDLYEVQKGKTRIIDLRHAHYEFLFCLEDAVLNLEPQSDLWIEGCWSQPYRIVQIIATINNVCPGADIQVHYILRSDEWYDEHLDKTIANYAKEQSDCYEIYNPNKLTTAAVYTINDENKDIKKVNF